MGSVETIQQLKSSSSDGLIKLESDLDFSSINEPLFTSFSGVLEGNGYTISGLSAPLIEKIENGIVQNLNLKNCLFVSIESPCGILCKNATGKILNVNVEGSIKIKTNRFNKIGGIVGKFQNGIIKNCSFSGEIESYGHDIGGLIGDASSIEYSTKPMMYKRDRDKIHIIDCEVDVKLFGGDSSGGIVGNAVNIYVLNCITNGEIEGGEYTGGIVGHSTKNENVQKSSIKNCQNFACLKGQSTVGGIVGLTQNSVHQNMNMGKIQGKDNVGGICGHLENSEISNCTNKASVEGREFIGGIVGQNASSICNCINKGNISGVSVVGGIVGQSGRKYLTNSTLSVQDSFSKGELGGIKTGGLIGIAYNTFLKNVYSIVSNVDHETEKSDPICYIFNGGDSKQLYWDSSEYTKSELGIQKKLDEETVEAILIQI